MDFLELNAPTVYSSRQPSIASGTYCSEDSFVPPSRASALNERQPLCFVPVRPTAVGGHHIAPALSAATRRMSAMHQSPSASTQRNDTLSSTGTPTKKAVTVAEPKRPPNPLRQLPEADKTILFTPSNIVEYHDEGIGYRNIQVTKDLLMVAFIKRQDQAKFEAHLEDPRRPFGMLDRVVILIDVISFKTGAENLPKDVLKVLQKQKDLVEFVCRLEYVSFDQRRPASRYFTFFDKHEFDQWTSAFERTLQVAVQYYQVNPNPISVNRLWMLGRNNEGHVTRVEMNALLDLHAQIKIKETAFERMFQIIDDSRQGFLDRYGFELLYTMIMKSEVADRLWKKYAGTTEAVVMSPEQFQAFLKAEQGEEDVTKEQARLKMYTMFSVTKHYKSGKDAPKVFDKEMFHMFVTQSSLNYAGDEDSLLSVSQPMDEPLSQYFIHSVNLTSVQEDSANAQPFYRRLELQEMVEYSLEVGARSLCLKVQATAGLRQASFDFVADGTSKRLPLAKFIHILEQQAFRFSDFPLWLNLQICSLSEEYMVALVEALQVNLRFEVVTQLSPTDSPNALKRKYLIVFTVFRERELSIDTLRRLRGISCMDVVRGGHVTLTFPGVVLAARHAAHLTSIEPSAVDDLEAEASVNPNNLGPVEPLPGVLFDVAVGTAPYAWNQSRPTDKHLLHTGPIVENLYDVRARLHRLTGRPDRTSTSPLWTPRALAAHMLVRTTARYDGDPPPPLRPQMCSHGKRSGNEKPDERPKKVTRIFFSNREQDEDVSKEFDQLKYPASLVTRLLSHGIQMVEYEPFCPVLDRQVAMAFFARNRACGYVLKPWSLRLPDAKELGGMGDHHPHNENFIKRQSQAERRQKAKAKKKEEEKLAWGEPDGPAPESSHKPGHEHHSAPKPVTEDLTAERTLGDDDGIDPRERCGNATLYVRIISGANLLMTADDVGRRQRLRDVKDKVTRKAAGGNPTNPYVIARIDGHDDDFKRYNSSVVQGNGLSPIWNSTFEFEIHHREVAVLSLLVYHDEGTHEKGAMDAYIGGYSIPIPLLKKGYRVVPLADQWGNRLPSCPTLLCRFEELPSGNLLTVSANINRIKKQAAAERQRLELRKKEMLKENETLRLHSVETQKAQEMNDKLLATREDLESRYCHFGSSAEEGCAIL